MKNSIRSSKPPVKPSQSYAKSHVPLEPFSFFTLPPYWVNAENIEIAQHFDVFREFFPFVETEIRAVGVGWNGSQCNFASSSVKDAKKGNVGSGITFAWS